MKRIIEGLFCDDVKSNVFNFYKNKKGKWVAEKDVFFEKEYVKKYLETNCIERNHVLYDTDDFWACEICGEVFPNGCDSTDVENTGRVCDDCLERECHQCNCCGRYFSKDDLVRDIDGEYVCDNCVEDHYNRCDSCGALVYNDDLYWVDDCCYCCSCYEDKEKSLVRSYHDNPDIIYHYTKGEKRTGLLIGTEIETECGDESQRMDITKRHGNNEELIYQMHDGSLNSSGIECITQPMSKSFFDEFNFEKWMKELVIAGARSHQTNNCGLHVHLSREWFWVKNNKETEDYIVGLVVLFFSQNEENIKKFSRRCGNSYCSYPSDGNISSLKYNALFEAGRNKSFNKKIDKLKKCNDIERHNDRYDCVNTTNRKTVEFRVFRGTLNPETYRATVEFCIRIVEYAKYCYNNKKKELTWNNFVSFKKVTNVLDSYMTRIFGREYKEIFTEEY